MSNILKTIDLVARAIRRAVFAMLDAAEHRARKGLLRMQERDKHKFASSLEAGHDRIADAVACGGNRGAGRLLLNPGLPLCC
jgi:hypothetical protein